MASSIKSFGFKHADWPEICNGTILDVRDLPNPHSQLSLRELHGDSKAVIEFFESSAHKAVVEKAYAEILDEAKSIAGPVYIGCSGGKHRSVYIANRLGADLNLPVEHLNYNDK